MERIGDLMPEAARRLGLEDELRLARAIATFDALVAERVPAAAGACRVVRLDGYASSSRPTRRSSPRSSGSAADELADGFAAAPGRRPRAASCGSTSGGARSPRV